MEGEGAQYLRASGNRAVETAYAIEADLRAFAQVRLDLDDAELTRQCEQAIRNYDPCISCSAHFLDLTVERSLLVPNGAWFLCQVLAESRSW